MAASPYELAKPARREELFCRRARELARPIVYVNQVGGNDELIFDGGSCVVSAAGEVVARARSFAEDLLIVDLDEPGKARIEDPPGREEALAEALKLGLGDYVRKCGFSQVVLGLSGGIDSAVVAVLAADALGPENVTALAMPSRYSSEHSLADAVALAENLGIACHEVPIEPIHRAFEAVLAEALTRDAPGREVAEENVQARIRGNLVMAWSNAYGQLALATGNKSELACGYCTLYGDMAGGIAPIGDVLKTEVYELARHINDRAGCERIPENILAKPPSAELKPGQVDQDKLPPYDVLDGILRLYVTEDQPAEKIIAAGYDPALVGRILRLVDLSEYKRQQAARVLKVSGRAFGMGRRMPIAQRYIQGADSP
jgi:NAD+ synthase (glutamine-hydrolysing)